MFPPCIFVISPKCSMSGKWRFVMAIGDFSISLAQTGIIPLREAARGNTPIPSNRLPNLRAHIDRLSFCFFMCCFHFSAPFCYWLFLFCDIFFFLSISLKNTVIFYNRFYFSPSIFSILFLAFFLHDS